MVGGTSSPRSSASGAAPAGTNGGSNLLAGLPSRGLLPCGREKLSVGDVAELSPFILLVKDGEKKPHTVNTDSTNILIRSLLLRKQRDGGSGKKRIAHAPHGATDAGTAPGGSRSGKRSTDGLDDAGSSKRRSFSPGLDQSSGPVLHTRGKGSVPRAGSTEESASANDSTAWTQAATGGSSSVNLGDFPPLPGSNEEPGQSARTGASRRGSGKGEAFAADNEEEAPPVQARSPATPSSRMPPSTAAFPMRDGHASRASPRR